MRTRLALVLAVAACGTPSELDRLRAEAATIALVNEPRLDALVARIHVVQRELRGNLPGWEGMVRTAELANDELGLPPFTQTTPPDVTWRPSATTLLGMGGYVRHRAGELADASALAFLVADERRRYDEGLARVDANLARVEAWLAAR